MALAASGLAARPLLAQQTRPTSQWRAVIAATEDRLWTARVENDRTFLSFRDRSGQPVEIEPLKTRVVMLAGAGDQAYTFDEDGSFYRYADEWAPARDLPDRLLPVDLAAVDGVPYALVDSAITPELSNERTAASAPASRALLTASPLALVRYDQLGWSTVAACPPEVTAAQPERLRPRLCATGDHLMLFAYSQPDHLKSWTFDPATAAWTPGPPSPELPGLTGFWPAVVNRLPTLVASIAPHDNDGLRFFRLLGDGASRTWRPVSLELSPLPGSADTAPTPLELCGFNQHLALQVRSPDGSVHLRFGRFEGPPTLSTIDLLASPPPNVWPAAISVLRAAIVLTILGAIFAFRRGSLAAVLPLPASQAPAFILQRLGATIIDLVPFTAVVALILQLNWGRAIYEVAGLFSDSQTQRDLPSSLVVYWLLLSAGAYAVYCAIMELTAGRTVGKMLVGLQVVSEQGVRASAGRVVVRNLFRAIEVLPPFWILAFVMLLSRSRQRVGDIFARTLVVRRVTATAESDDQSDQ